MFWVCSIFLADRRKILSASKSHIHMRVSAVILAITAYVMCGTNHVETSF
jgi:hypothetical protein